jgi:ribulose-phosphate 3-epimerase
MTIIPSINETSFEEVKNKIKIIEPYIKWAHLDISDGTFSKAVTWHEPKDLLGLESKINLEIHLMVENVDKRIFQWFLPSVKRIFFHLDACLDAMYIIEECHKNGIEAGIAVSPDESIVKAINFKEKIDIIQILGVHAGPAGQIVSEETFKRIKEVRKYFPQAIIEVDGGMNENTAKAAKEAGADIIVASSAIFNGEDIKKSIENFKNL